MKVAWKLVHFKGTVLVSKLKTNNISVRVCRWGTCGSWLGQWRCRYCYIPPVWRSSCSGFIWNSLLHSISHVIMGKIQTLQCRMSLPPHSLTFETSASEVTFVLIIHFVPSQSPCLVRFPTQRDLLPYPVLTVTVIYFLLSPSSDNSGGVRRHISVT